MKKTFARVCSLLLVAVMLFSLSSCVIVKVPDGDIKAEFHYFDINVSTQLSAEDAELVRELFNGKIMLPESPSCGFGEDTALIVDGCTYCIASDTCGIIYVLEEDKYFHLSDDEIKTLHSLLAEYGFKFPCI